MKLKAKSTEELWLELPKETMLSIANVSGSDGHTIFKSTAYAEAGMPEQLLNRFQEKYKSDTSDPKSTIFGPGGKILEKVYGVYGLTVVESLADALGCKVSFYNGRGFRAQAAYRAIRCKLDPTYKD